MIALGVSAIAFFIIFQVIPSCIEGARIQAIQDARREVVTQGTAAFLQKYEGQPVSLWLSNDVSLELLPIKAGTFQMGSREYRDRYENPVRQVAISKPFWLGKTEVTQAQWKAVIGSNPSYFWYFFKGSNRPVERVSWNDAADFCKKLNESERAAGRLPAGYEYTIPTEAEWEYACNADTNYAGELESLAWYHGNSGGETHDVATKQPNAWGLYDMLGNVWEWCGDGVLRGGGYEDGSYRFRSDDRKHFTRVSYGSDLGFRLALAPRP